MRTRRPVPARRRLPRCARGAARKIANLGRRRAADAVSPRPTLPLALPPRPRPPFLPRRIGRHSDPILRLIFPPVPPRPLSLSRAGVQERARRVGSGQGPRCTSCRCEPDEGDRRLPDGAHFAAGSLPLAAYIWEVSTGRLVRTWPAHFKAISAMTFRFRSFLLSSPPTPSSRRFSLSSLLDARRRRRLRRRSNPAAQLGEHSLGHVAGVRERRRGRRVPGGVGVLDERASCGRSAADTSLRTVSSPAALCSVALDACEATLYAGAADGRVFEVPLNAAPSAAMDGAAAAVLEGHTRAVLGHRRARGRRTCRRVRAGTCRIFEPPRRGRLRTCCAIRNRHRLPLSSPRLSGGSRATARGRGRGRGGWGSVDGAPPRRAQADSRAPATRKAGVRAGNSRRGRARPIVLRGVGGASDGDASRSGSDRGSIRGLSRLTTFRGSARFRV